MAINAWDTTLSPEEETRFQQWKARYAPNDTGEDYDLRGAFKEGLTPSPVNGHWPDTYKKPNHPTFSNESIYANQGNPGHWEGDRYVPGGNKLAGYRATLAAKNKGVDPYADMSDAQFATQLYKRHYADMPFEEFKHRMNLPDLLDPAAQAVRPADVPNEHPLSRTERVMKAAIDWVNPAKAIPEAIRNTELLFREPTNQEVRSGLAGPLDIREKESWKETFKAIPTQVKGLAAQTIAGLQQNAAEELQAAHARAGETPNESLADMIKTAEGVTRESTQDIAASHGDKKQSLLQKGVQGAATSLAVTGPALAAGIVTRNPALAVSTMYPTTLGQKYGELRAEGLSREQAGKHAAIQGALEAGTELIPGKVLFKPGGVAIKRLANFLAAEIPGESVATITQALDDHIARLPGDATSKDVIDGLSEGFKQLPETIAAVALSGVPTVAIAHGGVGSESGRPLATDEELAAAMGREATGKPATAETTTSQPALESPAPPPLKQILGPPDLAVGTEGVARRPGEALPPQQALPAPKPTGQFEVTPEGATRELSGNEAAAAQASREARAALGSDNIVRVPANAEKTPAALAKAPAVSLNATEEHVALEQARIGKATPEQRSALQSRGYLGPKGGLLPEGRRRLTEIRQQQAISAARETPSAGIEVRKEGQTWNIYVDKKLAVGGYLSEQNARNDALAARQARLKQPIRVLGQPVELPADPTQGQRDVGNYRKPTVYWGDVPIKLENLKGQMREGPLQANGKPLWRREQKAHYGYFVGSKSKDKEGVDVYIGDDEKASGGYVIDQLTPDGKRYDEPKVVIAAPSEAAARQLYLSHFPKGWKGFGAITPMSRDDIEKWAYSDAAKRPIAWRAPSEISKRSTNIAQPEHDSILEYLSKTTLHGSRSAGLNISELAKEGLDPKELAGATGHGIRKPFTREGGTLDHAAEILTEAGYPIGGDKNKLLDLITQEIRQGKKTFAGQKNLDSEAERLVSKYQDEGIGALTDEELQSARSLESRINKMWEALGEKPAKTKPTGVEEEKTPYAKVTMLDEVRDEIAKRKAEKAGVAPSTADDLQAVADGKATRAQYAKAVDQGYAVWRGDHLSARLLPAGRRALKEMRSGEPAPEIEAEFSAEELGKLPASGKVEVRPVGNGRHTVFVDGKPLVTTDTKAAADELVKDLSTSPSHGVNEPKSAYQAQPIFYSALLRAAESAKISKGPASQWMATLRNTPGVKQEELDWSGIADWLGSLGRPADKSEVVDYLRSNQIEVTETLKESTSLQLSKRQRLQREADELAVDLTAIGLAPNYSTNAFDGTTGTLESVTNQEGITFVDQGGDIWSAVDNYGDLIENGATLDSRPAQMASDLAALRARISDLPEDNDSSAGNTKYQTYTLPGGKNYRELLLTLPDKSDKSLAILLGSPAEKARAEANKPYRSPHWDEPNILAHVRFDERIDADGKRVLHIAEVQSDWHQAGRKKGYAPKALTPEELNELTNVLDRAGADIQELTPAQRARRAELIARRPGNFGYIPDAPFKTTWPELAMKRMIRFAAENGFDRITWDTGATNADRYDLSKQVKEINAFRRDDGLYDLSGRTTDGNRLHDFGTGVQESKLADIVGKELAEKIARQPAGWSKYTGVDLKVGGEGMVGFYDKILPTVASKLVKKFGGNVSTTKIDTGTESPPSWTSADTGTQPKRGWVTVHSVDITPSMQAGAMGGFALFEPRRAYANQMVLPFDREQTKALDNLATRPNTTPKQVAVGRSAFRSIITQRDYRAGARLLASGIPKDFIDTGSTKLIGRQVETLHDLAQLAQVYRNPGFETLRIFYTRGNEIVHQTGLTSRLAGAVSFNLSGKTKGKDDVFPVFMNFLRENMVRAGADGYYLLHNHPSGNPTPSAADYLSTKNIAEGVPLLGITALPGFRGHVIVDNDAYGTITVKDGEWSSEVKQHNFGGYRAGKNPSKSHPVLGAPIRHPKNLAVIAKFIEREPNTVVIVGTNSKGKVSVITQFPMATLVEAGLRPAAMLRRVSANSGSTDLFAMTDDINALRPLFRAGVLRDAITPNGESYSSPLRGISEDSLVRKSEKGYLVEEPRTPYSASRERVPVGSPEHRGYAGMANMVIDLWNKKIGHKYGALGNLPESKRYLIERYKTLGALTHVREISRGIFESLSKASEEDSAAVYAYLTTAGAKPDGIVDEKIRHAAINVKDMIDVQGRALVDAGLLSEDSYEAYRDQYLPRVYLRHILDEGKRGRSMGSGKKLSDMGYLKRRKDIPEEVRKVILGEITNPAFLAAFGTSRTMRDLAMMRFLDTIASNSQWTPPQMLVEYDGRRVSPFWLQSEAAQIRKQADYIKAPAISARAKALADRLDTMANSAIHALGESDLTDFKQIPNSARYGSLRGVYVRKEIHEDLVGAYNYVEADSLLEDIFGQRGVMAKGMQMWKMSKVALNPPSHVRNMIGNAMMLHLSGVNGAILPVRITQAIDSIINKDRYYEVAVKYGLKEATFANNELYRIRDEWLMLQKTKKPTLNKLHAMFSAFVDKVGDVYQFEEALFKIAKLRDEMEKNASEADAMIEAHKWVFDYSLVPRWVRYLRNAPFGAPFLSYTYFVAPRLLETAVRRPWKYLPYYLVAYAIAQAIMSETGADKDDLKKLKKAYPQWMQERGGMTLLPWKDADGRWQVADLGYTVPWGNFTDFYTQVSQGNARQAMEGLGVMSGPVPDIVSAFETGIDPFTGREIANPGDTDWQKAMSVIQYGYDIAAPSFFTDKGALGKLHDAYTGKVDPRTGEPTLTKTQAWLRAFGVSIYPVDPEVTRQRNLRSMQFEIDETRRRLGEQLRDRNLSDQDKQEIRRVYDEEIKRRIEAMRQYQIDSEIPDSLKRKADAGKDKLTSSVIPIIEGKQKIQAVQALRDAGHPALAALFEELPARPRPTVKRALQEAGASV